MLPVKIYTKDRCPYCVKAKGLLTQKKIPYTEINIEGKADMTAALFAETGMRTVPQIFIGDECIGGCDDLFELEQHGQLDLKLSGS